ncbi:hypothetical protein [Clostridium botulinum]|nr:hypothetical protein [Clostridium botulinum]
MLILKSVSRINDTEIEKKEIELSEKMGEKVVIIPSGFKIIGHGNLKGCE